MGRILIIEDEPATQLLLQGRLRDLGHDVAVKSDGAQGFTEARSSTFDLFLVDMHLGEGVDGIEVCRRLKRDPETRNVPVVMISGRIQNRADLHRGYEAGCEAFLNKNDMALVEDVIRAMLRIKSLGDELSSQMSLLQQRNERLQEALQDKAELEDALARSASGAAPNGRAGVSPDGVVLVDPDGTVAFADRGARELFAKRIEGRSLGSLAPGTRLEAFVRDARTTSHAGFRFTLSARGSRPAQNIVVAVHPLVPSAMGAENEMSVVLLYEERRQQSTWDRIRTADRGITLAEAGELVEIGRRIYRRARLVAASSGSQRVLEQVSRLLEDQRPVMIDGEPGVGKRFVARTLHFESGRTGPLIAVSCSALGRGRIEEELFGSADRPSVLLQAQGGSLLVENPAVMSQATQARLADAVEAGKATFEGTGEPRTLDVRLMLTCAASDVDQLHGPLAALFESRRIAMLPLRERSGDVRPLARLFAGRYGMNAEPSTFSDAAWTALERYDWPGNVQELEDAVARACATSGGGAIELDHLPEPLPDLGGGDRGRMTPSERPALAVPGTHQPERSAALPEGMRELLDELVAALPEVDGSNVPASFDFFERWALHLALNRSEGDKLRAAELLSVGKSTLYRKLHKYEIR